MRALDPLMATAATAGVVVPALLAQLTFKSGTQYVWTGYGPLTYNGNTFLGLGSLAGVESIKEGIEVRADGTSVSLSGIDRTLYAECMTDIQLGAPAMIWVVFLNQGAVIGAPYLQFRGQVDKPSINAAGESITISLALENRLTNLQRPSARRYTSADQRIKYPDDTGFYWVEALNDIALVWG